MLRILVSKRSILLAAVGASMTACPDPDAAFDDYLKNRAVQDAAPPPKDMEQTADMYVVPDPSGEYMLGAAIYIQPGDPFLFRCTVRYEAATTPTEDEAGTLFLTLQPLVCDEKMGGLCNPAEPNRDLVGDPYEEFVVPVKGDGTFVADLQRRNIPGIANPITGRDIEAQIVLNGRIRSDSELCGTVTGEVFAPIELDLNDPANPSTFGATKVTAATLAAYLEAEKSSQCRVE